MYLTLNIPFITKSISYDMSKVAKFIDSLVPDHSKWEVEN